jgi:ubiquinone/menaquinone biosynthesis C-methylase UbiE
VRPSGDQPVTQHFEQRAAWWDRIYRQESLEARILRRRQQVALSWVDTLALRNGSRILEVGCGAGMAAVELAKRGHHVYALDRSQAMIDRTREHAMTSGVGALVSPVVGDVHRLMFAAGTFDLVIAIGVLSWLQRPEAAIDEMVRVVRPGGHALLTVLNSLDIAYLLDPRRNPALVPVKSVLQLVASALDRPRPDRPRPKRYLSWSIRRRLRRSGLIPIRQATVGFGPFTFLGRRLLSAHWSVQVDQALQRRTDRNGMLPRSAGRLYLVLAHKPGLVAGGVPRLLCRA